MNVGWDGIYKGSYVNSSGMLQTCLCSARTCRRRLKRSRRQMRICMMTFSAGARTGDTVAGSKSAPLRIPNVGFIPVSRPSGASQVVQDFFLWINPITECVCLLILILLWKFLVQSPNLFCVGNGNHGHGRDFIFFAQKHQLLRGLGLLLSCLFF